VPAGVEAALYLDNRFEVGRFGPREIELVQALSTIIGVAVENARLRREDRAAALELERARAELEVQTALQSAEVAELRRALDTRRAPELEAEGGLVGSSAPLRRAVELARRAGPTNLPILIEGESGTGKELLARFVHASSIRRGTPLHAVNCGALSEQLLESELFGHVRGAFTGAVRDHLGLFRAARGGTVLLDEVAEMSARMQTRLLRVLQEGEVHPVGSERAESVDVRVIAATNRHLADEVKAGRFREDLYYRLAGIEIVMPALRARLEDIPLLAVHFLRSIAEEPGMRPLELSRAALRKLMRYGWPGNVRELQQALRRAVVTAEGDAIRPEDLAIPDAAEPGRDPRSRYDRALVERALEDAGGSRTKAAELLGVSRMTLHRWLRRYGMP
jgi:transcriptional regulator with PAS, ATPase and Fis domain